MFRQDFSLECRKNGYNFYTASFTIEKPILEGQFPSSNTSKWQPIFPPPRITLQAYRSTNHLNMKRFVQRRPLGQFRSPQVLGNQLSGQFSDFSKSTKKWFWQGADFFHPNNLEPQFDSANISPWFGRTFSVECRKMDTRLYRKPYHRKIDSRGQSPTSKTSK